MTQHPDEIAAVDVAAHALTPGRWIVHFTIHGDPFVVPESRPWPSSAIATVSTTPADYGKANAELLAAAPTLAAIAHRWATGWSDVCGPTVGWWRRYDPRPIDGARHGVSVQHVEVHSAMTEAERDLIVALRAGHFRRNAREAADPVTSPAPNARPADIHTAADSGSSERSS